MAIKIEVTKAEVRTIVGKNGANAGKTFHIPEVTAYAHLAGEPYPQKCTFGVERDQPLPALGNYELDMERSLYVDKDGRLAMSGAPKLKAVGK